tara:strand:+ start:1294 stop:1995 length:702 start_codon:yes stop_codon:yes gene_type:complete
MDGLNTPYDKHNIQKFKEDNYLVARNLIPQDLTAHLYNYTLLKKKAVQTMILRGKLPPDNILGGFTFDQVPDAFGCYADFAMETLMQDLQVKIEKLTGLELCPTYSYSRIYTEGDVLERHKDRPSCEISATMCLGYDYSIAPKGYEWGMFVEKTGELGKKGKEVHLNPGDAIIYRGCDIEHWRDEFLGAIQSQVFMHYNDVNGPNGKKLMYDTKPHLGLPADFQRSELTAKGG